HIRLVPHVGYGAQCYVFDVIDRVLHERRVLKLGRYNDLRHAHPERLSFKTKVVSRCHAELWTDQGKFYIRDTGSSSGTFVNRVRLSASGTRSSAPYEVKDGDLIQLGVDYQGGTEPHYRAVRMRFELVQDVDPKAHAAAVFEKSTFRNLQQRVNQKDSAADECCICLNAMAPSQALFLAPCSHMYHYKCMRPLLDKHFPAFACPLCRSYSNLDASVEEDVETDEI
ncbi:SMAD/FHA domain-containing protein, partial [Syncephalastrum racemosum]